MDDKDGCPGKPDSVSVRHYCFGALRVVCTGVGDIQCHQRQQELPLAGLNKRLETHEKGVGPENGSPGRVSDSYEIPISVK